MRGKHIAGLAVALAIAIGLGPYYVMLPGDIAPLDTDYGRIFLPELLKVRQALLDGVMLEWNPAFLSGNPYSPLPNAAGLYPPLLLSITLFGTPMGVAVSNLLHMAVGALGSMYLARRVGAGPVAAAAASLLFLWSTMTRMLGWTLPMESMAAAWIPCSILLLLRALDARRPIEIAARAALAGAAYAGVAWAGGYISLLYGLVAAGAIAVVGSVQRPLAAGLGRAALALVVFTVTTVGLMLGRILPIRAWTEVTNRAGAISLKEAMLGSLDLEQLLQSMAGEGWIVFALALVGTLVALRERKRIAVAFGLTTVLFLALSTGVLTPFLYHYVPGFDHLRQPMRAWILIPTLLPPIAAYGLFVVTRGIPRTGVRAAVATILLALGAVENRAIERGPIESAANAPVPYSLSARLDNNAVLHEVARLREEEGPFRVHAYESTRVLLKHTHALHATYLGLETMEGILGNIVLVDYDVHYLNPSRSAPARMWGMLACRWVTSSVPRDDEGLTLIGKFAEDPGEIFEGSDGPFLYRNERCLPRAFLIDKAILNVDPRPTAWGELNAMEFWEPVEMVLVDAGADPDPELLARFDAAFALNPAEVPEIVRESGIRVSRARDGRRRDFVDVQSRIRPLEPPREQWNGMDVELPADAGGNWLVLAETFALYPGWTAEVDGVPVALHRANGAATALALPPGARRVELRYRAPELRKGLALSALTGLALVGLLAAARRAHRRAGQRVAEPAQP